MTLEAYIINLHYCCYFQDSLVSLLIGQESDDRTVGYRQRFFREFLQLSLCSFFTAKELFESAPLTHY